MKATDYPTEVRAVLKEAQDSWEQLEFCMKYADRELLFGPPGTGKTTLGSITKEGQGLVRTMITPETSAAEVRGHWMITPSGSPWIDGPGLAAWRDGSRLVIDEIDQAGGDTIPLLHALLDDTAIAAITLPDGSTIKPKEGFTCVATMNSDPTALPEALRDRFVGKHHVRWPNPVILDTFPEQIRPFAAMSIYQKVPLPEKLSAFRSTRTWVRIKALMQTHSLGFADAMRAIGMVDPKKLLEETFGTLTAVEQPAAMAA